MKYLRTYNESVRDMMKPKSQEDQKKALDKMIDPNEKLMFGVQENLPWAVKEAIEKGADVNLELKIFGNTMSDLFYSLLQYACYKGSTEIVKLLVKAGADIELDDELALRTAIAHDHKEIIRLLNNPEMANESVRDAMIPKSKEDVMKSIKNMVPNEKLILGCQKDIPWVVQLAFDEGADIEALGEKNLSEACRKNQTELAKVLIKNGADIHQKNDYCIMIAIINGNVELTKLLFEKGADCKVKDWVRSQVRKYGSEEMKELVNKYMGVKTNESVRDSMKPKSREEVEKATAQLKVGGMIHIYEEVIGKTLTDVRQTEYDIHFDFEDGSKYQMYNDEAGPGRGSNDVSVTLEDVNGEWSDLIGEPLTIAEEVINTGGKREGTWTFYKFATIKGYVDLRWYGESNGYYSETVCFEKIN